MIEKIIEFSLKNRLLLIALFLVLIGVGIWAMNNTPIDAIPDIGENQVIVFTDWPGRSPKDVEDQITYPLSVNLQGLPGVKTVRSSSAFGFSIIYIIFKDNIDFYWARTRVLERLNLAQTYLPYGVTPILGPDATGLGQIFWYTVEGDGYDISELRSIQDWYIRYQLNSVAGVSEVASVGGYIKQYQIDVDPNRLLAFGVKLGDVFNAVKRSNLDVGAKVLEENNMEFIVRGIGFIKNVGDIENIVISSSDGVPVYVKNIANVTIGPDFRRGALDKEGHEAVGGVVIMRYGENPLQVTESVKQKIKELEPGLPKGVKIVSFYDRTGLIKRSLATLRSTLFYEIIITVAVIMLFLLHFSSTLIVSMILPVGVLLAFIAMYFFKIDANIMSLGGIAIAIGAMVDYGIIVTENIFRHLSERKEGDDIIATTLVATKEIARPLIVAMMTTVIGFMPIFALRAQEGKLFIPLAYTKTFAMVAAVILSLTLVPVLCTFLLRGKLKLPHENYIAKKLHHLYEPAIRWALSRKKLVVSLALAVIFLGIIIMPFIGREFMPPLDEGSILFMPVTVPSASLTQVKEIMKKQDEIIGSFPEVSGVVGKLGRAETATDPAPVSMIETVINLKPKSQWRKGMTKDKLVQQLDEALRIPGVSNIWTQPIINRIDMLSTGIRTQVGVKVFGDDLATLQVIAEDVERVLRTVPGAVDLFSEKIVGKPYIEFEIDRKAAARYGIKVGDIQDIIMTAIGGNNITTTVENRERYPIRVRYSRELRDNIEALGRILVSSPAGVRVPISQVAKIKRVMGPAMINSENGLLRAYVLLNVRGRDMVGFVEDASRIVAKQVKLPPGYFIKWSGQFENQVRAKKTLLVIVPIAFLLILAILYKAFNSFPQLIIVILGVPVAVSGGLIVQILMGFNFSVAVWVGYIALAGIATDAGVIMVSVLNDLFSKKGEQHQANLVVAGALLRVRPIVMTVATTALALLPIMFLSGTGSEIMKPMAAPIIGGLVTATLYNLFVVPVLYLLIKERGWHYSQFPYHYFTRRSVK
ncbi:MAG: efflux RND transporter permease subunit [Candidatus Saganbacteria bacterium]|nr:efflux RND transporter permease subunit [Candidatus Saganbacteria bacterium]